MRIEKVADTNTAHYKNPLPERRWLMCSLSGDNRAQMALRMVRDWEMVDSGLPNSKG